MPSLSTNQRSVILPFIDKNKKRKGGRGGGAVMVVFDLKYHKPKILLPAYA